MRFTETEPSIHVYSDPEEEPFQDPHSPSLQQYMMVVSRFFGQAVQNWPALMSPTSTSVD